MNTVPFVSAISNVRAPGVLPPYVSQKGNAPANDCGLACALMLARWLGKGSGANDVTWWSLHLDPEDDGTSQTQLASMLTRLGLTPTSGAGVLYPYIQLVRYVKLPQANKSDPNGDFYHWIVRLSDTTYHDPYHFGAAGMNLNATKVQLDLADASIGARISIVERPIEKPTMSKQWQPKRDSGGARVRLTPDKTGLRNIAGVIDVGYVVPGESVAGGEWVKVPVKGSFTVGNVALKPSTATDAFDGFVSTSVIEPATAPPPPPPPTPTPSGSAIGKHPALPALSIGQRFGVHMLNVGRPETDALFDMGCRSFTCLNNIAAAREVRARGGAAIVRHYIDHGVVPPAGDFARGMGVGRDDTFMVMGINEADSIATDKIEERFAWDKEFAQTMHSIAPRCFVLIGSWSMGTPQLEIEPHASRFRNTYGAFLNANADWCGVNYHCYSGRPTPAFPPNHATVIAPEWFEMRFLKYAYSPQHGGINPNVVIVGDESFIDVGGTGGATACGYTEEDVARWWNMRRALFEPFPQMYVHNAFMADGNNSRWAGYNVRGYVGTLARIWRGEIPMSSPREMGAIGGELGASPLPADYSPPAKNFGI